MGQDAPQTGSWMNMVSDARAVLVAPEDWQAGDTLMSVESTKGARHMETLTGYLANNFPIFYTYLKLLCKIDHDLLLSYYLLGVPQTQLGQIFGPGLTQTMISYRLTRAGKLLSYYMARGGKPAEIYIRLTLDRRDLTEWLLRFIECGDLRAVAEEFNIRRPALRRDLVDAAHSMATESDPDRAGLGEYIHSLLDGRGPYGCGVTVTGRINKNSMRVERAKDLRRVDPDYLGQFRCRIPEELDSWFQPRAVDHAEAGDGE